MSLSSPLVGGNIVTVPSSTFALTVSVASVIDRKWLPWGKTRLATRYMVHTKTLDPFLPTQQVMSLH